MLEPVCRYCGEGPNRRGCLIRGPWSTTTGGYRWAHRWCADHQGNDLNEEELIHDLRKVRR
jgi:hypothetical protein